MTSIKKIAWSGFVVSVAMLLAMATLVQPASAVIQGGVTIGTASAGLSTNGATGTGTYQTVTDVAFVEAATTDIAVGTNTFTIAPAAGWQFNPSATVTVTGAATADITSVSVTSVTSTLVTVNVVAGATATTDTITVSGIQARPTNASTAVGAANGVFAVTAGAIANLAGLDAVTLTTTLDAANYVAGGSGTGATSTATKTGGSIVVITAQGTGVTSATFQTTAGTFATNGATSLFCADNVNTCDLVTGVNNVIQVQLALPASGNAVVTVTPTGGGTVSNITIATQSAASVTTVTLGTPTPAQLTADVQTTGSDISISVLDQNGTAMTGQKVTVSTNLGVLSGDSATACDVSADNTVGTPVTSCTITTNATGDTIELFPTGTAGTATVTVTVGSVTSTKTVVFAGGTPASLSVDVVASASATALGSAVGIVADRQNDTSGASSLNSDEALVVVRALDSNGTPIVPSTATVTVTVTNAAGVQTSGIFNATKDTNSAIANAATLGTVSGAVCTDTIENNVGGTNKAAAECLIDIDAASTSPIAHGVYTLTAKWVSGSTTLTQTATITVAGPAETVTVALAAGTVGIGDTTVATATVLDAEGNPVADGTTVNFSVSSGLATLTSTAGAVTTTANTSGGAAKVNLIGLAKGQGQLVAFTNGKTGSAPFTVGDSTVPTPGTGDGTLTAPNFGDGNVGSAVFAGGTIEQLAAQVTAAGGTAVWVQGTDGNWYRYNTLATGATAFVNNAFNAQFEAGLSQSAVFVVK